MITTKSWWQNIRLCSLLITLTKAQQAMIYATAHYNRAEDIPTDSSKKNDHLLKTNLTKLHLSLMLDNEESHL